jgi:hypothetical protein
MNTPLYHADHADLDFQQEMQSCLRPRTEQQTRLDFEFDQLRPTTIHFSRSVAWFAGDDPLFCANYLFMKEKDSGKPNHIYRVNMTQPSKHPMYLIGHAVHFLEDKAKLTQIIKEYWNPTYPWKCWEYLSASMTPLAIEATPDFNTLFGVKKKYSDDSSLAMKLWPIQNHRNILRA